MAPTDISTLILNRHSIRFYKHDPVPRALLTECLELAQHAPSNSNIQNWRIHLASDSARDRIVAALSSEAQKHGPEGIPPLPEEFRHFRSEFGHLLYGQEGYNIPRDEAAKETLKQARMRNFSFFDAPVVGLIAMNKKLAVVDAMSVGMFIEIFCLGLVERGLGSCLMVSVMGYESLLRREFGVGDEERILCGLAIGWPKEDEKVNALQVPREGVENVVKWVE